MRDNKKAYLKVGAGAAVLILASALLWGCGKEDEDMAMPEADGEGEEVTEVEILSPSADMSSKLGTDGPCLDYADEDRIIFHGSFGLYVYSESRGFTGQIDLEAIGCDISQGDDFCNVSVEKDGTKVYLHFAGSEYMYCYDVEENRLFKRRYDMSSLETFRGLSENSSVGQALYIGERSFYCAVFEEGDHLTRGYLESTSGMLGDLTYVTETDAGGEDFRVRKIKLFSSGDSAVYGNGTKIILNGTEYDLAERSESINACMDILSVNGYWVVEGHINPQRNYYCFYNTATGEWDREIAAGGIAWCTLNNAVESVPFSLESLIYHVDDGLYDRDGSLIQALELEQGEYIRNLYRDESKIVVEILTPQAEIRVVTIEKMLSMG